MRAVVFGYFGMLTDPGAEEYRERAGPGRARYRVDPDDARCEYTVDDPAGLQIHMPERPFSLSWSSAPESRAYKEVC